MTIVMKKHHGAAQLTALVYSDLQEQQKTFSYEFFAHNASFSNKFPMHSSYISKNTSNITLPLEQSFLLRNGIFIKTAIDLSLTCGVM